MVADSQVYCPPTIALLRWLVDPGPDVPDDIRCTLLSRMFASQAAIIMGVVNSTLVSLVALGMRAGLVFAGYMAANVLLGAVLIATLRDINRMRSAGIKPPVNGYLIAGILWCALQGLIALTAMQTGLPPLQLLATLTICGIIGPICARNYPAPRYCMLLVMLCDLPFVAGCVFFGTRWLLIVLVETPPFLLAMHEVIWTFQRLAIDTLTSAKESQHRATHDALTGLLNRRWFREAITHQLGLSTSCLGVLALDLDGFKAVNDLLGHHGGDALLEAVAGRLSARVRPIDSVIRLGGDEFAVLLDNVTFAEASRLADRLIQDIGHLPYRIDGAPLVRVGVSIGIACAPEDGTDIELLLRRADLALYEAKADGKGTWRRFVSAMEKPIVAR